MAQKLNVPLYEKEFEKTLKEIKVGKAPGPDGFPLQYFKTFKDILKPHILAAFRSFDSSTQVPSQMLEAHIAVNQKEGKDPSLVTSYRPISLINVDVKVYAKILANRLLPLLPSLVSLDQVGFIPGREGRDNTIKALNLHHWLNSYGKQGFFLSLDAEKALTEWPGTILTRSSQLLEYQI